MKNFLLFFFIVVYASGVNKSKSQENQAKEKKSEMRQWRSKKTEIYEFIKRHSDA